MNKEVLVKATRWAGLVSGVCCFVVGIVHLAGLQGEAWYQGQTFPVSPEINWPSSIGPDIPTQLFKFKFTADVNRITWRNVLFSFNPYIFMDAWTPLLFGLVGTLCHFRQFQIDIITKDFPKFFIFNFVMGLFGCIGYEGGLGILLSIPIWITCLGALISSFTSSERANLDINLGWIEDEDDEHHKPNAVSSPV